MTSFEIRTVRSYFNSTMGLRHQSWSTYMCNNPFNPVMPWSTFALTHLYAQPWLIYPTIDPDTLIQLSMFWLYDPYIMSNPVATWMYLLWHKLMHVWLYNPCLIRIDTYICLIYTECPLSWSVLVYIYIYVLIYAECPSPDLH